MRWQSYRILLLLSVAALVMTVLTVIIIHRYIERQQQQAITAQRPAMLTVVVAAHALTAGVRLGQQDLRQRHIPDNGLAHHWLPPEQAAALIGRRLAVAVEAGQPLAFNLLQPTAAALSEVLQAQQYALTLSADLLNSHHGLIQLGDLIDMEFLSDTAQALQAIPVVAIDQRMTAHQMSLSEGSANTLDDGFIPQSLTLALTAAQRQRYQQASSAGVRLWLRSRQMATDSSQTRAKPSAQSIRISYLKRAID